MNKKRKQLAMEFIHLNRLLSRYLMQKHTNRGINPDKGQGRILTILKMQPEIVQKELGYLLDISKQALAELINKLEKKGYITRTRSEKDRRSFVIKLTELGREAMPEKKDEIGDEYIEEFFKCLNENEQNNLINYIERITEDIEKKTGCDDDYALFFRERFFTRHGHIHGAFNFGHGFNHHKFRGFRGSKNDE